MIANLLLVPSLLAAALPGDPPPAAPAAPAEIFPHSSYGIVEFAGLDACRAAAAEFELLGFLERLLVRSQGIDIDGLLESQVVPEIDAALRQVGLSRADVRAALRGPVALGLSRLTFFDEDPLPSLALAVRAGDAGQKLFDAWVRGVGANAPQAQNFTMDVLGVRIDGVRAGNSNGAIAAAQFDGWTVLASNPHYLADVVRTARGEMRSLAADENYLASRGQRSELLSVYLNTGPLFDMARYLAPYEAEPILAALGVQRVNGLRLGLGMADGHGHDVMFASVTHDEDGLVAALTPRGVSTRMAKFCPPNTLLTMGGAVDVRRVVEAFGEFVEALPGEVRGEIEEELERELAQGFEEMGVEPQSILRFLSGIGPDLSLAVTMPTIRMGVPAGIPPVFAFLGAQREGTAEQMVKFLSDSGAPIQTVEFEGMPLYYARLPEAEIPLTPAMAQIDGMLVFSSDLRALKGAIRRAADPADPSLADEPDFAAIQARAEGAVAVQLLRIKRNLAAAYEAYAPLLEGMLDRNPDIGLTMEDMPSAEELESMLADFALGVRRDERGVTMTVESPVSPGAALGVLGSLLDRALAVGGEIR